MGPHGFQQTANISDPLERADATYHRYATQTFTLVTMPGVLANSIQVC